MLADAVAEVENVRRTDPIRVIGGCCMGCPEAVQHPCHFGLDLFGLGKQDVGVDIALQGFAGHATAPADQRARARQVHGPVQTQHLAVE